MPYSLVALDQRWVYYETEGKLLNRPRPEMLSHLPGNEFLVTVPEPRQVSESRPLPSTTLFDLHLHDRGSVGFPAVAVREPESQKRIAFDELPTVPLRSANLEPAVWETLKATWKRRGGIDGQDAMLLSRNLFRLILAVCHSPAYEEAHAGSLAQDWAHIPIPRKRQAFDRLVTLGEKLAVLLDPTKDATRILKETLGKESPQLGKLTKSDGDDIAEEELVVTYSYYSSGSGRWVARPPAGKETLLPRWGDRTGDLYLNEKVYLAHVPEQVWRYELGGYPVIKKWLGYRDAARRNGKPLTIDEAEHLTSIVRRVAAVLALHGELDIAYEAASIEAFTVQDLGLEL